MTKSRITITISAEADQMLDELSRDQMRSRGAVIELPLRAARSGTQICADAAQAHTTVAQELHSSATPVTQPSHLSMREVSQESARSNIPVAQESRDDFHSAMLNLDSMCS